MDFDLPMSKNKLYEIGYQNKDNGTLYRKIGGKKCEIDEFSFT